MPDKDEFCFVAKDGKIVCARSENSDEKQPFDSSREYMMASLESSKNTSPFRLVKSCNIQGRECFRRNLSNAAVFIVLFLIAGMVINFLHEFIHYSFLMSIGFTDIEMTFSSNFGITTGSLPAIDDPSIPWHWWSFELLGPLVIINFSFLIISVIMVHHVDPNPAFDERTITQETHWIGKNLIKAFSYSSAFSILSNTIFSPFYSMLFNFVGSGRPISDSEMFWKVTFYMPEPFATISRVLFIIIISIITAFTMLFVLLYNRRDMGS